MSPAVTDQTVLRPGLIEGLDEAWCSALVHQGIRTLHGLVEAGSMALARRLGRPYTQLVDLQSLAQRLLRQADTAPTPEPASIEVDDEPREFTLIPRPGPSRRLDEVLTHDPFSGGGWGANREPGAAGPFT